MSLSARGRAAIVCFPGIFYRGDASNIGQMLVPVAAGQIVALTAGYSALFIMSIVAVAVSAAAIIPVRKVK